MSFLIDTISGLWSNDTQHTFGDGILGEENSVFKGLPMELYGEVFKYLDVPSLKACRKVCFRWALYLYHLGFLDKKTLTAWNIGGMSVLEVLKLHGKLMHGQIKISTNGFRLHGIGRLDFHLMTINLKIQSFFKEPFEHVTHLEILKSHISCYCLFHPFGFSSAFKNLVSLTIHDVYVKDTLPTRYTWLSLKFLKIYIKNRWELDLRDGNEAISFDQVEAENSSPLTSPARLAACCYRLEDYSIQIFDTGLFNRDNNGTVVIGHHEASFYRALSLSLLGLRLEYNARTLKSYSINTYDFLDDRTNNPKRQYDHAVNLDAFVFSSCFIVLEHWFPDLNFEFLKLERFCLNFRLVKMDIDVAQRIFLPFLQSQTALKEFSLSLIYFDGDGGAVMDEILGSLPPFCQSELTGIMTLRQVQPDPQQFDDTLNPITGHFDSVVEMTTRLISLTLHFVSCQSLDNIDFFTRNIRCLTKIKIQQTGAKFRYRIILGDADLQRITRAKHLTELWLEFCNLTSVTDFGLTGISSVACQRMMDSENFELLDGDLIGTPINELKDLRVLNLSSVGDHVTDLSIFHALKNLPPSMTHFGISKPNISRAGLEELSQLFQYNQTIRLEIRCPQIPN